MKSKKIISTLLVFVMSIGLLAGCGGKNASASKPVSEAIKDSMKKSMEIKSYHGITNLSMNLTLPEALKADPRAAKISELLSNLNVSIEQNSVLEEQLSDSKIQIDANGQKFDFEMYGLPENKLAIKTPFIEEIIVIDPKEISELAKNSGTPVPTMSLNPASMEDIKPVVDLFADISEEMFKDIEPTERKTEEIEFSDGKQSLDMITYSFKSSDELLDFVQKIANNLLESEKLYDLISDEKFLELSGMPKEELPSKEEFDKELANAKEQFNSSFEMVKEEFKKSLTVNEITLKMGINEKGIMNYSSATFDVAVKQGGMEAALKMNMSSFVDKIDSVKKEDIKTIDVTDENSINAEEATQQLMPLIMGAMSGMDMPEGDSENSAEADEDSDEDSNSEETDAE